jgi:hypothetical protein
MEGMYSCNHIDCKDIEHYLVSYCNSTVSMRQELAAYLSIIPYHKKGPKGHMMHQPRLASNE